MKLKEILIGLFAFAIILVVGYLWFSPGGAKQAPDLSVTTLDGRQMSIKNLKGRPVLVTFWATTCPGCVKEIPHLAELYQELSPKGFEIVSVAMQYDPPEQVRAMAAQRPIPYPVAIDTDGSAARAFGNVQLTPTHFLIDAEGRIVQQKLGEWPIDQLRSRINAMLGKA
jgi:peroxiredoxin